MPHPPARSTPIAARLAMVRAEHGLTLSATASALGVDITTVLLWEAGLEPPPQAGAVIERWLDDVATGRVHTARAAVRFALCEAERRAAAGAASTYREIARTHRGLITDNEDNDEELLLAHETYLRCLEGVGPAEGGRLADLVDDRYARVEDRLTEMLRHVAYLRGLSREVLAGRGLVGQRDSEAA